jgi:Ca2+-binding RTX toxin-like protein
MNNNNLEQASQLAIAALRNFAGESHFWQSFELAFGANYDRSRAEAIRQEAIDGNLMLPIRVLDDAAMGVAVGAFAAATNTIYLRDSFVKGGDLGAIGAVIVEELGHSIDSRVNKEEAPGDEGAIFRLLVGGGTISADLLAELKAEDDWGSIVVDGQKLLVEMDDTPTEGNDTLTGDANDNFIDGLGGDDLISGLGGDDYLIGGTGNDTVNGGIGNDYLVADEGIDSINGDDGNDYLYDIFGIGNTLNGGIGDDTIVAGVGSNVNGGAGIDTLVLDYRNQSIVANVILDAIGGGSGSDGSIIQNIESFSIYGSGDNDSIDASATSYANNLSGYVGNDTLKGGNGNDYLFGGYGNDVVNGNAGNDYISGDNGNDVIFGGDGNDTIFGNEGIDALDGGDGNDYLDDQTIGNTLNGGSGNDTIIGGIGSQINGGTGYDSLVLNYFGNTAKITLDSIGGGFGIDGTIIQNIEAFVLAGSNGNDFVDASAAVYNNTIYGNDGDDTFLGGSVNDYLYGGSGLDLLVGGAGNDYLFGNEGNDSLDGNDGSDFIYGDTGEDSLNGGIGDDNLFGEDGNDLLIGDDGNDYLYGGNGNDIIIGANPNGIYGSSEIDILTGGSGGDQFILGDRDKTYYDDLDIFNGINIGFALIADFNPTEDQIQLHGAASNYLLQVVGTGTNILLDKPDSEPDELIGIILNSTGLNLTSSAFQYVTSKPVHNDFNDDQRADILWRNTSTGNVYIYQMNGLDIASEGSVRTVSLDWKIAGTGDFNGDKKSDILWRNSNSGETYLYQMNGSTVASEGAVRTVSLDWKIAGTGDFNGDSKSDILWRNQTTGDVYIYQMDGLAVANEGLVRNVSLDWKIAGIGDFNGDNKSDILWRNTNSGATYIYQMNGFNVASEQTVRNVSNDWVIEGVDDLNNDGKSDILWRNSNSGTVYGYLMNNFSVASEGAIGQVPIAAGWDIAGTGDNNGDGNSDILWRNVNSGLTYSWQLNGLTKLAEGGIRQVSNDWQIASPTF